MIDYLIVECFKFLYDWYFFVLQQNNKSRLMRNVNRYLLNIQSFYHNSNFILSNFFLNSS